MARTGLPRPTDAPWLLPRVPRSLFAFVGILAEFGLQFVATYIRLLGGYIGRGIYMAM